MLSFYGDVTHGKAQVFIDTDAGWYPFPSITLVPTEFSLEASADDLTANKSSRSAIQISAGMDGGYSDTKGGLYDLRRTFNLKVENVGSRSLSECKLSIERITPDEGYRLPRVLKESFSLAPGEYVFVPIATYGEARDPKNYPCGDSFATMATTDGRPFMDRDARYTAIIRATGIDTPFEEQSFVFWVNEQGRFQISPSNKI